MKINLQINNTTQSPVADDFLQKVAEETFKTINYSFCDGTVCSAKEIVISIALVEPEKIKELNAKYRQYDAVTDILSFPEHQGVAEIKMAIERNPGQELFLGELILCYNDVKEYAQAENIELTKELANVVSHGILHLLGFSHGEEMFAIQEKIKNKI